MLFVAIIIILLRPSGRPSTQRIWVVTCDLSANGVMPRHQFSMEELLIAIKRGLNEKGEGTNVGVDSAESGERRRHLVTVR